MNKICILSLIKDEQRYLEEWIEFHYSIGVNHFILVEDFNSSSHKDICDKYDFVDLYTIKDYINDDLYQNHISAFLKNENNFYNNRQHSIFYQFLLNENENHIYDYMLFIDIDEFLNIDKFNNISELIDEFKNYDQYYFYWVTMKNKNPFIKLDYKYSVVDTFDIGEIFHFRFNRCKILLKLSKNNIEEIIKNFSLYKKKFPHRIDNLNNGYKFKIKSFRYSTIYLRHYLTKSWDEYLHRLINKGESIYLSDNRTFNDFFIINYNVDKETKNKYLDLVKDKKVKINTYEII